MVDGIAAQLGEHFEAVQILVSGPGNNGGGTQGIRSGVGNWYARQGMAHEFIEADRAQEHAVAIASQTKPDE